MALRTGFQYITSGFNKIVKMYVIIFTVALLVTPIRRWLTTYNNHIGLTMLIGALSTGIVISYILIEKEKIKHIKKRFTSLVAPEMAKFCGIVLVWLAVIYSIQLGIVSIILGILGLSIGHTTVFSFIMFIFPALDIISAKKYKQSSGIFLYETTKTVGQNILPKSNTQKPKFKQNKEGIKAATEMVETCLRHPNIEFN